MRHDRIIDLFGGNTDLANLIGRSDSAVSRWRINGIPPNFWPEIAFLSRLHATREISIESLASGSPSVGSKYRARSARAAQIA